MAFDKQPPGRDERQPDLVQAFGKRGPRRSVVLELRRRPFLAAGGFGET